MHRLMIPILFAAASVQTLAAAPAQCVTSVESFERAGAVVSLKARLTGGQPAVVRVEPLSPHVVRVRAAADGNFQPTLQERDGFIKTDWARPDFRVSDEKTALRLEAGKLALLIEKKPFRLVFSQDGKLLTSGTAQGGVCFDDAGQSILAMASPPDEGFYGFGYNGARTSNPFPPDRSPYNHRGHSVLALGISSHRHHYVPFFMSSRGYGLFLNTVTRNAWDMAQTRKDRYSAEVDEPRLDAYFIAGPLLRDVLGRYTEILGRATLPPVWKLGGAANAEVYGLARPGGSSVGYRSVIYHGWNVRWADQREVEATAKEVRAKHQSADMFLIDSQWQTIRNSFDWVAQVSDPKSMLDLLNKLHFRTILWQRPTPVIGEYKLFQEGVKNGFFVKGSDGEAFTWSHGPQVKAMVDFTNPAAVRWWQEYCRRLIDLGAAGFKLDSESSGFNEFMPEARELKFHNGMTGRQLENYYGPLYLKVMTEGLRSALKGRRGLLNVYHQAYFANVRYPYFGLGDRSARTVEEVKVRDGLNLALCGVPYWEGAAVSSSGPAGVSTELKMRLIPYTYSYWRETFETGVPIIRPLMLEYQDDPETFNADSEFLYGREFLVAPDLRGGGSSRRAAVGEEMPEEPRARSGEEWRPVYLPPGEWINYWTKEKFRGPGTRLFQVKPGEQPILVRSGSIIPRAPVMEYVGQKAADPLTLEVYPSGESSFTMYEDDGETYAYESGAYSKTVFDSREGPNSLEVGIGAAKGAFPGLPARRTYALEIYGMTEPVSVSVAGQPLAKLGSEKEWNTARSGWYYRIEHDYSRTVRVKVPDVKAAEGAKVRLDGTAVIRQYF